VYWVGEDT
jgi:hypothetical protein